MSTLAEKLAAARYWPEYKDEPELEERWNLLLDVAEAAVLSAELAPRVPDGNKFGHDWTIPNPVIDALDRLADVLPEPVEEQT